MPLVPLSREHLVRLHTLQHAHLSELDRERFRFLDDHDLDTLAEDAAHKCFVIVDDDAFNVTERLSVEANRPVVAFGHLSFFPSEVKRHVARLGVAVSQTHRGQGLGQQMVTALLYEADLMGIRKVWLTVRADNYDAIRLYERTGFRLEGVFQAEEYIRGTHYDVYSMAIDLPRSDAYALPWAEPSWDTNDVAAMQKVLQSGWLTQGKMVRELEHRLALALEVEDVVVCNSGTSALLLVATFLQRQLGIRSIVAPALSFAATAAPFKLLGYNVQYVDVDQDTALMNIWRAEQSADVPVVVHLGGSLVNPEWIAGRSGPVVIDAAQALGQCYTPPNALSIYSFHAAKVTTTIEGGAVAGRQEWIKTLRAYREHGAMDGSPTYHAPIPGFNLRMTDIQAAMGLSQLDHHVKRQRKRQALYNLYRAHLPESVELQPMKNGGSPTLAMVKFPHKDMVSHAVRALNEAGIGTRPVWKPLPYQFGTPATSASDYQGANEWWNRGLLLPMSSKMSEADVEHVVYIVKAAVEKHFPAQTT